MLSRLRGLAGLCAAVVPAAIVVHLGAEALALGPAAVGADFVLRHLYLAVLLALSLTAFARTLGLGAGRPEIRRRTALLRSRLRGAGPFGLPAVIAANLAFFGLTQAAEGVPLASGVLWLGLAAGVAGSILAAVLVRAVGGRLLVAAVEALVYAGRRRAPVVAAGSQPSPRPARSAAAAFTLFIPNRPPPHRPSSDHLTLRKGILCSQLLVRRVRQPRLSSLFSSS